MLIEEVKAIKSTKKELKDFGIVVGTVFAIMGGLLLWRGKEHYLYFLSSGGVLVFFGFFAPAVLKPLQKVWMGFAVIMGWFMTRVILSIFFFGILTPIRIVSGLFGKKFLDLKIEKSKKSYWHYRETAPVDKTHYENQF